MSQHQRQQSGKPRDKEIRRRAATSFTPRSRACVETVPDVLCRGGARFIKFIAFEIAADQ